MTQDAEVRAAAFARLAELKERHGEILPVALLVRGFVVGEERIPFVNRPRGIFRPRQCDYPLSVKTAPPTRDSTYDYEDDWSDAHRGLLYEYRQRDPTLPDNRRLAAAKRDRVPLIYFLGVSKGNYLAEFVRVVHADDRGVTLQVASPGLVEGTEVAEGEGTVPEYRTRTMRDRVHRAQFRARVLIAYRSQCALCRLRLRPLLDAAHIVPDSEGGRPVVANGLSLCKIHHAAFDENFLGIRPEGVIEIHTTVLDQEDGPMLRHGLQKLHGRKIVTPYRQRDRPDPAALEGRYEQFRAARPDL